jgi:hypothetical protein
VFYRKIELRYWNMLEFFWSPNNGTNIAIDVTGWEMMESITWYLKNTKKILLKFQENCIYIKKISYEYILYILSLQFEIVTTAVWKESRKLNLKWYALVERESNERTWLATWTAWFFSFLNQTGSVRFGLASSSTPKPETEPNQLFS